MVSNNREKPFDANEVGVRNRECGIVLCRADRRLGAAGDRGLQHEHHSCRAPDFGPVDADRRAADGDRIGIRMNRAHDPCPPAVRNRAGRPGR